MEYVLLLGFALTFVNLSLMVYAFVRINSLEDGLDTVVDASSPQLDARVDELTESLERLRMTHQRFAGRVSQFIGAKEAELQQNPLGGGLGDRDQLRAQHAQSIMPPGIRR